MKKIVAVNAVAVLAVGLLFLAPGAQADSGKYTAKFGWHAVGKMSKEKGGAKKFNGKLIGTAFNTSGGDFANNMSTVCPITNNISKDGTMNASGTCTMTDKSGDTIKLKYTCQGAPKCKGTFTFTGGTGKFKGISGKNDFFAAFVTQSEGYSAWDGQYKY